MQRQVVQIGPKRPQSGNGDGKRRTKLGNPHRNGLFYVGLEIWGLVGLDGGVRSQIRTRLDPELPDKWPFTGYFCELAPVIEKCTRIHCLDSMACKRIP
jgi:hypothetical protein